MRPGLATDLALAVCEKLQGRSRRQFFALITRIRGIAQNGDPAAPIRIPGAGPAGLISAANARFGVAVDQTVTERERDRAAIDRRGAAEFDTIDLIERRWRCAFILPRQRAPAHDRCGQCKADGSAAHGLQIQCHNPGKIVSREYT